MNTAILSVPAYKALPYFLRKLILQRYRNDACITNLDWLIFRQLRMADMAWRSEKGYQAHDSG